MESGGGRDSDRGNGAVRLRGLQRKVTAELSVLKAMREEQAMKWDRQANGIRRVVGGASGEHSSGGRGSEGGKRRDRDLERSREKRRGGGSQSRGGGSAVLPPELADLQA